MVEARDPEVSTTCSVCLDSYSSYKRRRIVCQFCAGVYCSACLQRYLAQAGKVNPDCMLCLHAVDMSMVRTNTPRAFYADEYPKYVSGVRLLAERAKLPETMLVLDREKQVEFLRLEINKIAVEGDAEQERIMTAYRATAARVQTDIRRLREKQRLLGEGGPRAVATRSSFGCPVDDCRGVVFAGSKACGLCGGRVCPTCRVSVPLEAEHECDPGTVATLALIKQDARPCPTCRVSICKIDGCDQMWCPRCQTAFSWAHGTIDRGRVHAPGFYEYLRARATAVGGLVAREPGDTGPGGPGGCVARPELEYLMVAWRTQYPLEVVDQLAAFYQRVTHLEHYGRGKFPETSMEERGAYLDTLRLAYLRDTLSEEDWRARIQHSAHRLSRRDEARAVYRMSTTAALDILSRTAMAPRVLFEEAVAELTELARLTNVELRRVSVEFKTVDLVLLNADFSTARWSRVQRAA